MWMLMIEVISVCCKICEESFSRVYLSHQVHSHSSESSSKLQWTVQKCCPHTVGLVSVSTYFYYSNIIIGSFLILVEH